MTKTEQKKAKLRVAVAKDVLKQLGENKIKPVRGMFVEWEGGRDLVLGKELQPQMDKMGNCRVCNLGALFLSTVRLDDKFICASTWHAGEFDVIPRLRKLFDPRQLELLELAFERGKGWASLRSVDAEGQAASRMFPRAALKTRIRSCMENIIKNGGTFVVPVKAGAK